MTRRVKLTRPRTPLARVAEPPVGRRIATPPGVAPRRSPTKMQKVAPEGLDVEESPPAPATTGLGRRLTVALGRTTDGQLAPVLRSAVLFVLAAWPLLLVAVPPFQDLPNHLAAITVIEHPAQYPEFVFNGLFKTNSALFTWLYSSGSVVGTRRWRAKLFALLVLALGALAYPRFVLSFAGRRRMVLSRASSRGRWCTTGSCRWACSTSRSACPLATFLLVGSERAAAARRRVASGARRSAVLGVVTWHAHVFPLLVVHLLMAVARRDAEPRGASGCCQARRARRAAAALDGCSSPRRCGSHSTEPVGAMTGYVRLGEDAAAVGALLQPLGGVVLELHVFSSSQRSCRASGWASGPSASGATDGPLLRADRPAGAGGALLLHCRTSRRTGSTSTRASSRSSGSRRSCACPSGCRAEGRWRCSGACALSYTVGMGVDYVRLDRDWHAVHGGHARGAAGREALAPHLPPQGHEREHAQPAPRVGLLRDREADERAAPLRALAELPGHVPRAAAEPQFNHLVLEASRRAWIEPTGCARPLRSGGVAIKRLRGRVARAVGGVLARRRAAVRSRAHVGRAGRGDGAGPADYRVMFQRDELTILERR